MRPRALCGHALQLQQAQLQQACLQLSVQLFALLNDRCQVVAQAVPLGRRRLCRRPQARHLERSCLGVLLALFQCTGLAVAICRAERQRDKALGP